MIRNKRIMRLAAAILCLAVIGSGMPVYAAAEAAPEETDPLPETYLLQLEQTEHGELLADGTKVETRGVVAGETVILQAFPADTLREDQVGQGLGIVTVPTRQQVLEPLIPIGVRHAVADHHGKAARLQGGGGDVRTGRRHPDTHRQAAA